MIYDFKLSIFIYLSKVFLNAFNVLNTIRKVPTILYYKQIYKVNAKKSIKFVLSPESSADLHSLRLVQGCLLKAICIHFKI